MIKIYSCEIETLAQADYYELGLSKLLADRINKIEQMRSPMDQVRSMGAGLLLDYCLKMEGIEAYSIEVGEHGKPYLKGEKMPFFNLSHSKNLVICGISDQEIGVDIQLTKPDEKSKKYADAIIRKHFTIEEQNYIESYSPDKRMELFYSIWTGKESYIKMTGKGFLKGLDSFVVDLEQKVIYDKEELRTYPLWHFLMQGTGNEDDYHLSVCKEGKVEEPATIHLAVGQLL